MNPEKFNNEQETKELELSLEDFKKEISKQGGGTIGLSKSGENLIFIFNDGKRSKIPKGYRAPSTPSTKARTPKPTADFAGDEKGNVKDLRSK